MTFVVEVEKLLGKLREYNFGVTSGVFNDIAFHVPFLEIMTVSR